jgi:ribosomal protein L37AE/L43A
MEFDWSEYNKNDKNVCECLCGEIYKTHTRIFNSKIIARESCPKCNRKDFIRRATSVPEIWGINT